MIFCIKEYTGNYVYENNNLQFFNSAEGYVTPSGSSFKYVYQYKDHLGNVRLSYSDGDSNGTVTTSEIIEENNYYPFGLKHKGYNSGGATSLGNNVAQRYKFGGKELQDEIVGGSSLEWYDITARNYDPALGRWMNLDPLAEQMRRHSPYNYAFNNPIFFIDPDGLSPQTNNGFRHVRTAREKREAGESPYPDISKKRKKNKKSSNDDKSDNKDGEKGKCDKCKDQTLKDGHGNVEKQQFQSTVKGSRIDFEYFKSIFISSPQKITNNNLATYVPVDRDGSGNLSEGDHIDIDILGPDNGSVRVAKIIVKRNNFEVYFQALEGHPDAGNIRFSGTYSNGKITFEVFNITRVNLGWYSDAYPFGYKISPALARGAQVTQWKNVLNNFDRLMGGSISRKINREKYEWDRKNQTIGKKIR